MSNTNTGTHRTKRSAAYAGFTLVELVVVLGVILLLSAIAVPMVQGYLEDGRRARAQAELKSFGAAVMSMYKDTGKYPVLDKSGKHTLRVVCTGEKPKSNPFKNNSAWNQWLTSNYGDSLDNHLFRNSPGGKRNGYATTGERQWRGPYVSDATPLDPWGRPYVAMVLSSHSTHKSNYRKLIFLSAGENGIIETSANCTLKTEIEGDDIGFTIATRKD